MVSSTLNAWMNGEFVGTWRVDRGSHCFTYDPAWLESQKARSLSLSLPITASREIRGPVVAYYFDNLLPDNDQIRERLARRFDAASSEAFPLLQAIGRDCVGAVQLLPEDVQPQGWNQIKSQVLDEPQIVDILRAVPTLGVDDGDEDLFRISISGAQEKTAFLKVREAWCRPRGATPTTHIFKLPLGSVGGSRQVDLSTSVENEWLCAQLAGELGLPVAQCTMGKFAEQTVLIVERFDREWMDGGRWIARLPQEDFCQALGVPPGKKYEQHGGPGMKACLQLLQGSADAHDPCLFQLAQLAFWLLGATDGHAKNYSIFLQPGDSYVMTPLYDILSMWPYAGDGARQFRRKKAGLAMAIRSKNAHYAFDEIQARHWHQLAMANGGPDIWLAMQELVERVPVALGIVQARLPRWFNEELWKAISSGMTTQVEKFRQGLGQVRVI